jgi:HSP20 family protein
MTDLTRWFDNRRSPIEMIERLFEGDVAASGIRVEHLVEGTTLVSREHPPLLYRLELSLPWEFNRIHNR